MGSWPTVGEKGDVRSPFADGILVAYTDDGRPVWMEKGSRPVNAPAGVVAQLQMQDILNGALELGAAKLIADRIKAELDAATPEERAFLHEQVFDAMHKALQRFDDRLFEHPLKNLIPEVAAKLADPDRAKLLATLEAKILEWLPKATAGALQAIEREVEARVKAAVEERVKAALDVAVKGKVHAELAEVFKRVKLDVKVDMEGINDLLDRVGG